MNIDKTASQMTLKEFKAVKMRESYCTPVECHSIVILPMDGRSLHDSGYRSMDFVALDQKEIPICRLSGCSDVIHINGICGFGDLSSGSFAEFPKLIPPISWSIDCLPKSGLLRLFAAGCKLKCGDALSSFELFAVKETKEKNG